MLKILNTFACHTWQEWEKVRELFTYLTQRAKFRWEENITVDITKTGVRGNLENSSQNRNYWRVFVNATLNFKIQKPWWLFTYFVSYS